MQIRATSWPFFIIRLDAVGDDRGRGALIDDDRVDKALVLELGDKGHIIINIYQIDSPQRVLRELGRYEEILVADGVGFDEIIEMGIL